MTEAALSFSFAPSFALSFAATPAPGRRPERRRVWYALLCTTPAGPRCSVQCRVRHASPRGPRLFRTTRFLDKKRRRPPSPRLTNFPTQPRSSAPRPPAPDERQAEARLHFSFPPPKLRTAPSGLFRLPPENTTTKRPPGHTVQKTPGAFPGSSASPTPKHRPHICIRRAEALQNTLVCRKNRRSLHRPAASPPLFRRMLRA